MVQHLLEEEGKRQDGEDPDQGEHERDPVQVALRGRRAERGGAASAEHVGETTTATAVHQDAGDQAEHRDHVDHECDVENHVTHEGPRYRRIASSDPRRPRRERTYGDPMSDAGDFSAAQHRAAAIDANNSAWELLDGRDLGATQTDELLERAYAAAHHWRRAEDSTVVNLARAAWLVSRAQTVAGHGDAALHHAERCAVLTDEAGDDAADFDRAYSLEAQARAHACRGDLDRARAALDAARAVEIADAEDREIVESDLAAPPWFGLGD